MIVSVIEAGLNLDFSVTYELKKSFLYELVFLLGNIIAEWCQTANNRVSDGCNIFCVLTIKVSVNLLRAS